MNTLLCDTLGFVREIAVVRIAAMSIRYSRGSESIYLHRSRSLLENGLDRLKNRCYGRYGVPSFYSISASAVGWMEPELASEDFLFLITRSVAHSLWLIA